MQQGEDVDLHELEVTLFRLLKFIVLAVVGGGEGLTEVGYIISKGYKTQRRGFSQEESKWMTFPIYNLHPKRWSWFFIIKYQELDHNFSEKL